MGTGEEEGEDEEEEEDEEAEGDDEPEEEAGLFQRSSTLSIYSLTLGPVNSSTQEAQGRCGCG